jgi:hypothetical protein
MSKVNLLRKRLAFAKPVLETLFSVEARLSEWWVAAAHHRLFLAQWGLYANDRRRLARRTRTWLRTEMLSAPAVLSSFVIWLDKCEFWLWSRFAIDVCADCFFDAGHVAQATDAIVTDELIDHCWRDLMTGERVDAIPRVTLVNNEEIYVAVSIVEQVAALIELHDSPRSPGMFSTNITV